MKKVLNSSRRPRIFKAVYSSWFIVHCPCHTTPKKQWRVEWKQFGVKPEVIPPEAGSVSPQILTSLTKWGYFVPDNWHGIEATFPERVIPQQAVGHQPLFETIPALTTFHVGEQALGETLNAQSLFNIDRNLTFSFIHINGLQLFSRGWIAGG